MFKRLGIALSMSVLFVRSQFASARIYITEFCSDTGNNEHFEFVEFTNVGVTNVDMAGWSEDDSHATANQTGHSLTGFGTLTPGQSAIFTEATPANFRSYWGLPATMKVVGPYTNDNLNTMGDSITLFDNTGTLVDELDYSTTSGGDADSVTRNAPLSALGLDKNILWVNSFIGDKFGSFPAPQKTSIIGNPGSYSSGVPEPTGALLIGIATILATVRRRTSRG